MADLIDDIRSIALKIEKTKDLVGTEEATKNAFVMPFITALGYDVFDPSEVTPELVADVGVKKGEKIDYAILQAGKPIMIFECKHHGANLDNEHASQLYRYFACTECRVAVLTNGVEYRFFTDLENSNRMDSKPFLVFKVTDFPDELLPEVKKFVKSAFNLDSVLSTANELKYTREIKQLLVKQLQDPSDDFVRFCAAGIGVTRMSQSVRAQFSVLTKKAMSEFVSDRLGEKLKAALGNTSTVNMTVPEAPAPEVTLEDPRENLIQTTVEELEAFYIIKSILHEVVDLKRVVSRDQQSYFGILLDDSNRKPIVRLRFNSKKQKHLSLILADKSEERVPISHIDEIYQYADRIRDTVRMYESTAKVT